MKKITLLSLMALFTLLSFESTAQTIFSENFNGTNPLTNWTLINVDGRTPAANVNYVTAAWVIREDFDTTGVGDNVAVSTSWYTPAGQADDYLISPAISLNAASILAFDAKAQDPAFPDGYSLLVSTTTPTAAGFAANPALFTVGSENAAWTRRTFNLSAYANQTVYFAWRNTSNDQFLLLVDNVLVFDAAPVDAALSSVNVNSLYANGSSITVSGTIRNTGTTDLTSVDVNWSLDNGVTVNTNTITSTISSFQSANFTHTMNATASNAGTFSNMKVWVSQPNSVLDTVNTNDTLTARYFVNNGTSVSRNVLLEEFTTAPCQFCPDGAVVVEQILATNPAVIAVGEHACFGTDAMTIPEAVTYCNAFGSGAPTACIDRVLYDGESDVAHGRGTWASNAASQANVPSAVTVNINGNYDQTTRAVNVTVSADFVDYALPGDLRLTLFVVEDSVTGSGTGYNQVNFYNNTPGHPYQGAGNPIVGYVHKYVLRDVYPTTDAWGDGTVIPSNPAPNSSYSKNYTFNLNPAWKSKDVSLVAFVNYFNADVTQREVLNSEEVKLDNLITGLSETKKQQTELNIYPNPANDRATLELSIVESAMVEVSVLDMTGKQMKYSNMGTMSAGNQILTLDLADLSSGFYFVNIKVGNEMTTKKISVLK